MRKLKITILCTIVCASAATAKNTDEDWKWENTYYATYGEWTTACEVRPDDVEIERCYLRYVDVYAQNPFGALFVFATVGKSGPRFSFEYERGTEFSGNWAVTANNRTIWSFNPDDCPLFGDCVIDGDNAERLLKALASIGAGLNFSFTDRHDRYFDRSWPGDLPFSDAVNDLQQQSTDRNL